MSNIVLLDTGPLGMYTNPKASPRNEECRTRVRGLMVAGLTVRAPGIAVYEVRRALVELQHRTPAARRLERFDSSVAVLGILPVTETVMHRASEVWGQARYDNYVTAPEEALDGDVILAAQAFLEIESGNRVQIATCNAGDLKNLFPHVIDWDDLKR